MEKVILVNEHDNETGTMEKMEAHRQGLLHRAFSILVYNNKGQILLQKRALGKYHSGGLWSNTCCSHPRPGESVTDAANRRLREEMGMDCTLVHAGSFIYKVKLSENLYEHELDHVLKGITDAEPVFNREEVADFKYMDVSDLEKDIDKHSELYTFWLKELMKKELI